MGNTPKSCSPKALKIRASERATTAKIFPLLLFYHIGIPKELPSIEETLKVLAVALVALKTSGLDQSEV